MKTPRVDDAYCYRRDASVSAIVRGVSECEITVDLDGRPYGFSWGTFANLFEVST